MTAVTRRMSCEVLSLPRDVSHDVVSPVIPASNTNLASISSVVSDSVVTTATLEAPGDVVEEVECVLCDSPDQSVASRTPSGDSHDVITSAVPPLGYAMSAPSSASLASTTPVLACNVSSELDVPHGCGIHGRTSDRCDATCSALCRILQKKILSFITHLFKTCSTGTGTSTTTCPSG